jgi:hypothetical protein
MIASTVTVLSGEGNWDPARLTASAFQWPPGDSPMAALGELATSLTPDGWVDRDAPVITPSGLDRVNGGINHRSRKHRGPVLQVGSSGERGVCPGDLLIPLAPEMPVLLIRPDLIGSMASSSFLALRPHEGLGLWLWGVLNSRSGHKARSLLAVGTTSRTNMRSSLLGLHVPLPPQKGGLSLSLKERLSRVELQTHHPEEEAIETWWRIVDLRHGDWQPQIATPAPAIFSDGVPLRNLCVQIVRGRPVPKEAISSRAAPELLPLTDISVIGGGSVRRWIPLGPKPPIIASPGDILIAAVGNRPHAYLVTSSTAVDRNLWLLRLHQPDQAPGLVHYLNGEIGYAVRQTLLTGSLIPGLRKDNLTRLPVLPETLDNSVPDNPLVPLDLQLEQVLWS